MDLYNELQRVVGALDSEKIPHALCGGLAVGAHGHVRATMDIDVLILPEDLETATGCLGGVGYSHSGVEIPFKKADGTIRKIHRLTKVDESDHLTVDLLLVEGPI